MENLTITQLESKFSKFGKISVERIHEQGRTITFIYSKSKSACHKVADLLGGNVIEAVRPGWVVVIAA